MWIKHDFHCFFFVFLSLEPSFCWNQLKDWDGRSRTLCCSIVPDPGAGQDFAACNLPVKGSRMTLVDITELCNSFLCFHNHGAMQMKFQSIAILYFPPTVQPSHINCIKLSHDVTEHYLKAEQLPLQCQRCSERQPLSGLPWRLPSQLLVSNLIDTPMLNFAQTSPSLSLRTTLQDNIKWISECAVTTCVSSFGSSATFDFLQEIEAVELLLILL